MTAAIFDARMREALAEVEAQRDDAIVYLSAVREVLVPLARGHGLRPSAQAIAEALVRVLSVESCAIALREPAVDLGLVAFATQAHRLGGPAHPIDEAGWLGLARLVGPGPDASCFRRTADGGFTAVNPAELAGEGFMVLPFQAGAGIAGALVLHWLVAPAHRYGRVAGLTLVGEAVGQAVTVALGRDAAERVADTLREELGQARHAVSRREEDVEQLARTLVHANQVKRDFLGTVSHELRTPLNAILGYSSLLRDGAMGDLVPAQTSVLDRVLSATRNLNELIGDMLFFVQADRDRLTLRPETVVAAEVIEEAVDALRERPEPDRVTFAVEVADAATILTLDRGLLRRIMFHLIGNAFKFTRAGRVTVRVEPGDEPHDAVITVADTGIGLPPDRVDELFELFTQGDSSFTREHDGLGMGLPLVERCVRLLGGQIAVTSDAGVGTTFRVHLPGVVGERPAAPIASAAR